ncbi:MAG: hydrogenase 4 subunit B, partial [Paracoccaceae bacterium]
NGLLVLVFIASSAMLAAWVIHRVASRELRRAPAWDCGFPLDDPSTQYSAASFAQPIRRTLGSVVFRAREYVEMPPPGSTEPARFSVDMWDPVWDSVYARVAAVVSWAAERSNHLQFLTIRRYLSVVFATLVLLLLVLTLWI